jgi:hypothetical protein
MITTKFYELKPWDKAIHWDETLTFIKVDWAYAQWKNEEGEIRIWHAEEYELLDGVYYPIIS